jgi:hypothetical protein
MRTDLCAFPSRDQILGSIPHAASWVCGLCYNAADTDPGTRGNKVAAFAECRCGMEGRMKTLPNFLIALAAAGTAVGLVVRLVLSASGVMRPAFLDPVFYWRGAILLLMFAVAILLIQIRNK